MVPVSNAPDLMKPVFQAGTVLPVQERHCWPVCPGSPVCSYSLPTGVQGARFATACALVLPPGTDKAQHTEKIFTKYGLEFPAAGQGAGTGA